MAVFQALRNLFTSAQALEEPEVIVPAPEHRYSIRTLTRKDLKEVIKLNARCFRNGENYTKHTFSYLLNDPNTLSYRVVTEADEMAGFVFVMMNPDGAGHVTTIGVGPEHRRRGLAKMMLRYLERVLPEKGVSTIVLEVRVSNISAQQLYVSSGFSAVQRVAKYYNDGEDGYLMMKSIT
ncbi:MAG: ribosomal protein S18-alanine N-acetyltransferase [Pyrinomonadaceae bacterium]|nr:ribosomal protein S18-alanine N-acetyltransferase [Pyrinomonadaceae bacterium]